LDAALRPWQSFGFRAKTPKTKVSSYTLPQGWSAKREIILNDRSVVQNFLSEVVFYREKSLLAAFSPTLRTHAFQQPKETRVTRVPEISTVYRDSEDKDAARFHEGCKGAAPFAEK
jgi:hypothetical protein